MNVENRHGDLSENLGSKDKKLIKRGENNISQ